MTHRYLGTRPVYHCELLLRDEDGGSHRLSADALNPTVTGDFDADTALTREDINLLSAAVAMGRGDPKYDLSRDGRVNRADVFHWAKVLKNTWIGDADVDGQFNSSDFVLVFQSGRYEQAVAAVWSEGDWNGDGRFDSDDFIAAFADGGYELARDLQSPDPAMTRSTGSSRTWTCVILRRLVCTSARSIRSCPDGGDDPCFVNSCLGLGYASACPGTAARNGTDLARATRFLALTGHD